ncbi:MAG: hypothetical protein WCL10_15325 [Novosphingobium sp.]|uniref:hypothetical protein n=1 Tax=Novosphingobium sp. TaxID=1874826 RepID=UPI0030199097
MKHLFPLVLLLAPASAMAQMDHSQMDHGAMDHGAMDHASTTDGAMNMSWMSMDGMGSGTSRLPATEAMRGVHLMPSTRDMVMIQANVLPVYSDQGGPRGGTKFYAQSMAMLMWIHDLGGGAKLTGQAMMSLEPAMRHEGYPLLFATGELANGRPLVDRQHPHDLFMELSARLDLPVAPGLKVFIYGGPVGEPALGPSAFMHRASAQYNPEAPITHHWFDSTHITYGVVTAGLAGKSWQIEASAFRGQEPDENRWSIERAKLDSWSVRASFAPSNRWQMQVSYGELKQPEASHPGENERRFTTSAHYNDGKGLSAMAAFSAKKRVPGGTNTAFLGEVNWDANAHDTLFGRIENVDNDELFPDHDDPLHDQAFRVTKFELGYAYRFRLFGPVQVALGGTGALFAKPAALSAAYGKNPIGATVFAKISLTN